MAGRLQRVGAACLAVLLLASPAGAASSSSPGDGTALARSLAAAERRLGPGHPDLLALIDPLAEARLREGDFAAAIELRRRAATVAANAFGLASVKAAAARAALAETYVEMQRYLDAEPLLLGARIDLAEALGPDDPALADVLCGLARIAAARGERDRAAALARHAVALDAARKIEDSGHLRVLGAALAGAGQFAEGERVLARALAAARSKPGAAGLAAARALWQLGDLYLRQDRFAEALPPLEQAAAIDQDRLGAGHPLLADDWHDIGAAWFGLGRSAAAEKAFRKAVDLLRRGPARETPRAATIEMGLARVSEQRGHRQEAQQLFEDARRILHNGEAKERDRERVI